jgi:MraZ protein
MTVAQLPLAAPLEPDAVPVAPRQPVTNAGSTSGWSQPVPVPSVPAESVPALQTEQVHTSRIDRSGGLRPLPALASVPLAAVAETFHRPRPLTGTHSCTLGEQYGLTLPKRVRQQLGEKPLRTLYVAPGPEQSLWLYTAGGLERLNERLERSPAGDSRVRQARRLCFAQAEKCDVDRSGQMHLPDHLAGYAGLQQEVVLLGVGDHLEVWDARRWQEYLREGQKADKGPPEEGNQRAATER